MNECRWKKVECDDVIADPMEDTEVEGGGGVGAGDINAEERVKILQI